MMKKYTLNIYIDPEKGTSYAESADILLAAELRNIVAVLEQIKLGIVMQLNFQAQPAETNKKEKKAD